MCASLVRLTTAQVAVGVNEGLKHDSAIHCDELVSIAKTALTDYVGSLSDEKIADLDRALAIALGLNTPQNPT